MLLKQDKERIKMFRAGNGSLPCPLAKCVEAKARGIWKGVAQAGAQERNL